MSPFRRILRAILIGTALLVSPDSTAFARPVSVQSVQTYTETLAPPQPGASALANTPASAPSYLPNTGDDGGGALLLMVFGGVLLILAGLGLNLSRPKSDEHDKSSQSRQGTQAHLAR